MSSSVRLDGSFVEQTKIIAKVFKRSLASQIEYWARIGKISEENPDLTYEMIKNILIAKAEVEAGQLEPYKF